MSINFQRLALRASLILFSILSQGQFMAESATAAEALPVTTTQKTTDLIKQATPLLASKELTPPVRLWTVGSRNERAFVITHGMGGTAADDRFHKLAAVIAKLFPDACVIRVDWCERASVKFYGLPNVLQVAASIDEVGDQAALLLQQEKIDPQHATFIGESFGNWVNARIAQKLGGVHGILALNPANEAGYPLPDLRRHTQRSWSFHTYSAFDTTSEIAANDCWLQTPAQATQWGQHVAGIHWLTARLEAGDTTWLQMDKLLPVRRPGHFQALVTFDGLLTNEQLPRKRPDPTSAVTKPTKMPAGRSAT
jgi:hypothetical protein